jgi:hypothetical protein
MLASTSARLCAKGKSTVRNPQALGKPLLIARTPAHCDDQVRSHWSDRHQAAVIAAVPPRSCHSLVSAESWARCVTETICSGVASVISSSSVHRLSDAARTAALAPRSKADAGMHAPSFGPVAEHVLVAFVEGVGGAGEQLETIVD